MYAVLCRAVNGCFTHSLVVWCCAVLPDEKAIAEGIDGEFMVEVDARYAGNESRYINDSKGTGKPHNVCFNRHFDHFTGEQQIGVLTVRDIEPDEEVRAAPACALLVRCWLLTAVGTALDLMGPVRS